MDDKTLVENRRGLLTFWETDPPGFTSFIYSDGDQELSSTDDEGRWDMPIAFPRTLKAARQILKEAGWTIVRSQ